MINNNKQTEIVDPMNLPIYVDIFQHIKGHNKHMTDVYLDSLSNYQLIMECHPFYFDYFNNKLFKNKQKS